jgi:heat shock protein HslJ
VSVPVHSVVRHEPHHTRLMRFLRHRILRVCAIGLTGVLGAACSTTVNLPAESRGADSSAVIGVDWHWQASRYNNDTAARPADPARYRLRVEPDGSLRVRVDCNQAGGRYRIDGGAISIEVTHSTRAACEPGSLDQAFLRDLGAAAIYFVRNGRLYLDLKNHTGTMEFARE